MVSEFEKYMKEAPIWQSKLEEELDKQNSDKAYINFRDVAYAFPSAEPNPYSFEVPDIDDKMFRKWANERGWEIDMTYRKTAKLPPVLFKRQPKRQELLEDQLLLIINDALHEYDECLSCQFTSILILRYLDENGCNWSSANLRCSGVSADPCRPISQRIITDAKSK